MCGKRERPKAARLAPTPIGAIVNTFPITAGPGCIVVMVTLSARASVGGVLSAAEAHAGIVAAVMLLSAAVYVCYGRAPAITARVRPETAHGTRVIAFVLLCIG